MSSAVPLCQTESPSPPRAWHIQSCGFFVKACSKTLKIYQLNMVGCFNNLTAEEADQTKYCKIQVDIKKPPSPNGPPDLYLPELEDIPTSFSDSFLDFDSINSWFVEGQPELHSVHKMADSGEHPVGSGSYGIEFRAAVEGLEMGCDNNICEKDLVGVGLSEGVSVQEKCEIRGVTRSEVMASELADGKVINEGVWNTVELCENSADSRCSIDEQLGKVSLDEELKASIISEIVEDVNSKIREVNDADNGDVLNGGERFNGGISDAMDCIGSGVKSHGVVNDKGASSSDDSESEDESSSSSSSSSSDDEDKPDDSGDMAGGKTSSKKEGRDVDVEEGEILLSDADELVGWSGNENDEDGGSRTAGPNTSKNELKVNEYSLLFISFLIFIFLTCT